MGKALPQDVFLIYILRGLGDEYREVKNTVYTRWSQVTFEELHNLLLTHEFVNPETHLLDSDSSRGLLPTPPPSDQFVPPDNSNPLLLKYISQTPTLNRSGPLPTQPSRAFHECQIPEPLIILRPTWRPCKSQNLIWGSDGLQVANGQQMNIAHTGSSNATASSFMHE
ncbi:hypothetical protein LIER_34665 [Lithospermum erythrorhizon]|uniref:Uncharacterized protein n=1 Tax=Lithospermum erythrorhizon TaxID=34254 RepID=A0AAV3S3I7_LITER